MGIEGASRYESNEAPMSREDLMVKNGIQREIIKISISQGEDIEKYPSIWIDEHSGKFHEIFMEYKQDHPELIADWEDETQHTEIAKKFKDMLEESERQAA